MAKSKGYHPKGGKFHILPLSSLLITFWGSCVPRCQFDSRLDQNTFSITGLVRKKYIYILVLDLGNLSTSMTLKCIIGNDKEMQRA